MAKQLLCLLLGFGVSVCCMADFLVLKGGKTFEIQGEWEVRNNFVVFKTLNNQVVQLPLKQVDLEASRKLTDQKKAEADELARKLSEHEASLKEKPDKNKMTLVEFAAQLEAERKADELPQDLRIETTKVNKFGKENPLPEQSQLDREPVDLPQVEDVKAKRNDFAKSYAEIQDQIAQIDKEIKGAESTLISLRNQLQNLEDPSSNTYELMEKTEKRIQDLKEKKKDKEKEASQVERTARAAGVMDVKRRSKDFRKEND